MLKYVGILIDSGLNLMGSLNEWHGLKSAAFRYRRPFTNFHRQLLFITSALPTLGFAKSQNYDKHTSETKYCNTI
jgi:hypothetical protein